MRSWQRRLVVAVGAMAVGGIAVSGPGTSCSSFAAESLLVTADFCFIFDCQNGALGGTLNPCSGFPSGTGTPEAEVPTGIAVFTDCPFDQP